MAPRHTQRGGLAREQWSDGGQQHAAAARPCFSSFGDALGGEEEDEYEDLTVNRFLGPSGGEKDRRWVGAASSSSARAAAMVEMGTTARRYLAGGGRGPRSARFFFF